MRLIDADRLIYELNRRGIEYRADIDEAIRTTPTVAVKALQERPTGEWKCMGDCGVTECGQCGWSIEEYVGDYNYCPNCGAKMDKE